MVNGWNQHDVRPFSSAEGPFIKWHLATSADLFIYLFLNKFQKSIKKTLLHITFSSVSSGIRAPTTAKESDTMRWDRRLYGCDSVNSNPRYSRVNTTKVLRLILLLLWLLLYNGYIAVAWLRPRLSGITRHYQALPGECSAHQPAVLTEHGAQSA